MPTPPLDDALALQALDALRSAGGNKTWAAQRLGLALGTFSNRIRRALERFPGGAEAISGTRIPQRVRTEIKDGVALVFADAHFWPGRRSVAHGAFLSLAKKLKPVAIFDAGDSLDGASISRHPMLGNDALPTVQEELYAVLEQRGEMMEACPGARLYWCPGNHCERFDRYLAVNAPKLAGVKGLTLADNLPGWKMAWAFEINWDTDPILVAHNYKGGEYASFNNVKSTSVHFVSGHDHRRGIAEWTNEQGDWFGMNPGTFADVGGQQFNYVKGRTKHWRSGFLVLNFEGGRLLPPELVSVRGGRAYFRGAAV